MAEASSQSDEKLDLKVSDSHGALTHFKVKKTTKFRKILTAYASKAGIEERAIRLMVDGERVNLEQCPGDLDMENGDQIDAMVEQQGGLGAPPLAPVPEPPTPDDGAEVQPGAYVFRRSFPQQGIWLVQHVSESGQASLTNDRGDALTTSTAHLWVTGHAQGDMPL